MNSKSFFLLPLLLLVACAGAAAQNPSAAKRVVYAASLPATCAPATGDIYIKTGVTPTEYYWCSATNTWTKLEAALSFGAPLQRSVNAISITQASSSGDGYLSSTDWSAFNAKQSALGFTPLNPANNLSDVASAATSRTNLGLAIGTNVEAHDADLDALAALPSTAGYLSRTGAGAFAARTLTGTTNQVAVTNPTGASGDPVFSLPQDIHTGAAPQFARLGLGAAADSTAALFLSVAPGGGRGAKYFSAGSSSYARFTSEVTDWWGFTNNASYSSGNWNLDDTTKGGQAFVLDAYSTGNQIWLGGWTPGSNPASARQWYGLWLDINNGRVGVANVTAPQAALDVGGAGRFAGNVTFASDGAHDLGGAGARPANLYLAGTWQAGDMGARPTCDSSARGKYWHDFAGPGAADTIEVCSKNADDTYTWKTLPN